MIKTILNWFGFGKKENPAKMSAVVAQAPAVTETTIVESVQVTQTPPVIVDTPVVEKKPHHFNRNRNRGRKKKHAMQSNNAAATAPTTPNANQQKRRGRPSKQK